MTLILSQQWHHDTACWQGYFAEQDEGSTPQAPPDPDQVEEKIAFALGDGRVGVLAVKGRKVLPAFTQTDMSCVPLHPRQCTSSHSR